MLKHIQTFYTYFLDVLFPKKCLFCNLHGSFICTACAQALVKAQNLSCPYCQKPSTLGSTHFGCKKPFRIDGIWSWVDYHDRKSAKLIKIGKYQFIESLFEELTTLLIPNLTSNFDANFWKKSTLCPIPLHPQKLRARGFNQAEIICKIISAHTGCEIAHFLKRDKNTKPQAFLDKTERAQNIKHAFSLKNTTNPKDSNRIILVDDIATTGSTLKEAAQVLKRNGVPEVWAITLAKD